jgi:DNA-binding CsgD family transcriptional regulator
MEAISIQKVQALIRCLERLYSAENLTQFPSAVFSALGEIIEGCVFSLDTVNLKTGEVTSETSDKVLMSPKIKNRLVESALAKQAIPMVRADAKGANRLTDCCPQWQLQPASLYLGVLLPTGVRRQTVVTLDIPGHVAAVTVNRDTDLTDEEVLLMSLAGPHVALAHRNLQSLIVLRAAAAQIVPGPEDLEQVGLSPREAEVLHWVMKGKPNGLIAGILQISIRTVHQHIANILRKLESESRASAGYEAMTRFKALGGHPQVA